MDPHDIVQIEREKDRAKVYLKVDICKMISNYGDRVWIFFNF